MKCLVWLLLFFASAAQAQDLMELHSYNSATQWRLDLEQTVEQLLRNLMRTLRPVPGSITSHFGNRYHPIKKAVRHHRGIDIACEEGSEVRVVLPGTVTFAGRKGGYGIVVIVEHEGEFSESRYAHLSELFVEKGTSLRRGEMIALSGSTGLATGPHLHFELYRDGKAVDPEVFMARAASNSDGLSSAKSQAPATSSLRFR